MIGKTLGQYEILGMLGKGGMREIYRASDPKLDRDVAIKVLPEEFAKESVMSIVSNTYFPSDILALIADERIAARFSKGYRLR